MNNSLFGELLKWFSDIRTNLLKIIFFLERVVLQWCWCSQGITHRGWFCLIYFIWQWLLPDRIKHLQHSLCISCVCLFASLRQLQDHHGICRDAEWWGHQGCGPGLSKWVRWHTQSHTITHWWKVNASIQGMWLKFNFQVSILSIICSPISSIVALGVLLHWVY